MLIASCLAQIGAPAKTLDIGGDSSPQGKSAAASEAIFGWTGTLQVTRETREPHRRPTAKKIPTKGGGRTLVTFLRSTT
jgi:hypothetical protein